MASIFDTLLNVFNKKNKNKNGDRNTTGSTVQAQAQQQSDNATGQNRRQGAQSYSANLPAFNQRPQQTQRSFSANTPSYNQPPQISNTVEKQKTKSPYEKLVQDMDNLNPEKQIKKPTVQENADDQVTANNVSKKTFGGNKTLENIADAVAGAPEAIYNGAKDIVAGVPKAINEYKTNRSYRFGMSDAEQEAIARERGASDEDIAQAKQTFAMNIDYINRNAQHGHTYEKMVENQMRTAGGLPMDSWLRFLPDDDGNIIDRSLNSARAGVLMHGQGLTGLQADIGNRLGDKDYEEDRLKDFQYQQALTQQALSGDNQGAYDRIFANSVSNLLTGLETTALGQLWGMSLGTKALERVGLGNMAVNSFGNAYGNVRTGGMGEQYTDDVDAARRYAYASALNELGQEKMFDALGLISGGKITENTIPGANVFGLGSFMTEAAEEGMGALVDPFTEAALEGNIFSPEYRNRVGEIYREQGVLGTLQNAGQSALEGGLGGVMGGIMSNPVQSARQIGTDFRAIRNAGELRSAIKAYERAMENAPSTQAPVSQSSTLPSPAIPSGNLALAKQVNTFDPNNEKTAKGIIGNGKNGRWTDEQYEALHENDKGREARTVGEVSDFITPKERDTSLDSDDWKALHNRLYDEATQRVKQRNDKSEGAVENEYIRLVTNEYTKNTGNSVEQEQAINEMRRILSRGALRASVFKRTAQRANEIVFRDSIKRLNVDVDTATADDILSVSNKLGIPAEFMPNNFFGYGQTGLYVRGAHGGTTLRSGIVFLPSDLAGMKRDYPSIENETYASIFMHEATHVMEGSKEYFALKELLRLLDTIPYNSEGKRYKKGEYHKGADIANRSNVYYDNKTGARAHTLASDSEDVRGTERIANLNSSLNNSAKLLHFLASDTSALDIMNLFSEEGITDKTRDKAKAIIKNKEAIRASRTLTMREELEDDSHGLKLLQRKINETPSDAKYVNGFSTGRAESRLTKEQAENIINHVDPYRDRTPRNGSMEYETPFAYDTDDNGNIVNPGSQFTKYSMGQPKEASGGQRLESAQTKAKTELVDYFDRILGMLPGDDNVIPVAESNRLMTELVMSEGKKMNLPDKLKHLESVFFTGTDGRPAVAPALYEYYKDKVNEFNKQSKPTKAESSARATKKSDQERFDEQVMGKKKSAGKQKKTMTEEERLEKQLGKSEVDTGTGFEEVTDEEREDIQAANEEEKQASKKEKKYWDIRADNSKETEAILASIFGSKNDAATFTGVLKSRFKLTQDEAKTVADTMMEKGFSPDVLDELVNKKGIKALATVEQGGDLLFNPHKELGSTYNEYAPRKLGFKPYTTEEMDAYDEVLATERAKRGSKTEFEEKLNKDDRKLLSIFKANAKKYATKDVDESNATIDKQGEGKKFVIDPDGTFAGTTVNNLYQGLIDQLRDVLVGRNTKLGHAIGAVYGVRTNSYQDVVRFSEAKSAFDEAKNLYRVMQDLKKNGVESEYFKNSGYALVDESTVESLGLKGKTQEEISKLVDDKLSSLMDISSNKDLTREQKLEKSLELFRSKTETEETPVKKKKTEQDIFEETVNKDNSSPKKAESVVAKEAPVVTEEQKTEDTKEEKQETPSTPVAEKTEEKKEEEKQQDTVSEQEAEKKQEPEKSPEKSKELADEPQISDEKRQELETLAYFRNQDIENANLPAGIERVQRKADTETSRAPKERIRTKSRIGKADTEVASMDTHEMMRYFRQEEWEGSEEYNKKTNEEKDNIDSELDTLVDDVMKAKDIDREKGKVHNTLAAILYRAGGKLEHVNALAKTYEETGEIKGRRDVERDILKAHKDANSDRFKDSASAEEFVRRVVNAWKKSSKAPVDFVQTNPKAKNEQKTASGYGYEIGTGNYTDTSETEGVYKVSEEKADTTSPNAEQSEANKTESTAKAEQAKSVTDDIVKKVNETAKKVKGKEFDNKESETIKSAETRAEENKAEQHEKKRVRLEDFVAKQAEKMRQASSDRLNYAQDFTESQTTAKFIKDKYWDEGLRARAEESHLIKAVKHDSDVKADASKWNDESGQGGVVAYAEAINRDNGYEPSEEELLYLIEGLKRANKLQQDIAQNIKRLENDESKGAKEALSKMRDEQKYQMDACVTLFEAIKGDGSEAGRALRAMRYLYETPELIPAYMRRKIAQLNKKYAKQLKNREIKLDQELLDKISDPNISDEERDDLWDKINYNLADQLPRTLSGRVTQWRKTGMLLNPRTHMRNIISNGLTYGMFRINDLTQAGIENFVLKHKAVQKILNTEYTEADRRAAARVDKDYMDAAVWLDKQHRYSREGGGGGKFNIFEGISEAGAFSNNNPVGKLLNDIARANNKALNKEDRWFVEGRAHRAMAEMLKSQGYKIEKKDSGFEITKDNKAIQPSVLEAIEREALKNAQEATYHDFNKAAKALEGLKKNLGIAGYAVDIIVPFTKTPANIMRRSLEFSPIGLGTAITRDLHKVRNGDMSASTYITRLSRGVTGTAAFIIGAVIANMGLLSKPDDDDDERTEYYEDNVYGKQDLALHIGDRYYSLDWAMPSSAPLMMGAAMANEFSRHGLNILDYDAKELLSDGAKALNPVLEASYLGSLSDFMTSFSQGVNYGGNIMPAGTLGGFERAGSSIVENLAGQMAPTVGGAINRTIDSTKRTTSGNTMGERMRNKFLMNAPFFSRLLQPAIDEKGNEIKNIGFISDDAIGRAIYNFVTPMTITEDTHDKLDSALMSVGPNSKGVAVALPRNQTGTGGLKGQILSDLKDKGMNLSDISAEEYTQVKKTYYGNYREYAKAYNELAEYNRLGTHVRDDVYTKLEQLALAEAKATYYDKVGSIDELYSKEQKAALALKEHGVSPAQFFLIKDCGLTGNRRALYVMSELENLGVADDVINDIMHQKYFASAVGLTDSVVLKTADEREDARAKYLMEDGETLESKVAAYRGQSNEEYEAKKEEDSAKSEEESWEEFFEKVDKKYGTNLSKGGTKAKSKGGGRSGSRRSSGGSSSSSSATSADLELYNKIMTTIMKDQLSKKPSASIKSTVDLSSDAKIWDTIVNGSKKDIEALKRELKLS